jgi:hypothetical protein
MTRGQATAMVRAGLPIVSLSRSESMLRPMEGGGVYDHHNEY